MTSPTIRVTIPSDPAAFGVLRSVAAGLAAVADLSFEAIEDVCLAVDEAALQLIGAGADSVTIAFTVAPDGLGAEVSADPEVSGLGTGDDAAIGRHILAALVDELHLGETVRFHKRSVA